MTPLPPIRRSRLRCSVELAVLLLAAWQYQRKEI